MAGLFPEVQVFSRTAIFCAKQNCLFPLGLGERDQLFGGPPQSRRPCDLRAFLCFCLLDGVVLVDPEYLKDRKGESGGGGGVQDWPCLPFSTGSKMLPAASVE